MKENFLARSFGIHIHCSPSRTAARSCRFDANVRKPKSASGVFSKEEAVSKLLPPSSISWHQYEYAVSSALVWWACVTMRCIAGISVR